MIGYDELVRVRDYCDASELKSPEEWAPVENIDIEGVSRFAIEDSMATLLTTLDQGAYTALEALTMGVVMGIRYGNLAATNQEG